MIQKTCITALMTQNRTQITFTLWYYYLYS